MADQAAGANPAAGGDGQVRQHPTAYERWQATEGIRVIRGFYVPDLSTVPLDPWERMGALGTFVNLEGTGGMNDAYVCEIPPQGSTRPQRHTFEELLYVLSGRGSTTVWNQGQAQHSFEWQAGSVFALPINAWYQHFNVSGQDPARFVAVTTAPLVMNLFHNDKFVFDNPFVFDDRYDGAPRPFIGQGVASPGRRWESNFVPDVRTFALQEWPERGAGGRNAMLEIGDGTLTAHISEFPVGTYKKAHRHGPGAHVVILSGHGYSLLWPEGEDRQRYDWKPGSVVVPPDRWFHQHFNTDAQPARYLALRYGSFYHPLFAQAFRVDESVRSGGDQIEYGDEDPAIRAEFDAALSDSGVTSRMQDVIAGLARA